MFSKIAPLKNSEFRLATSRSSRSEVFCTKGAFLEISQNSQENTCARVSFLIKLPASGKVMLSALSGEEPT